MLSVSQPNLTQISISVATMAATTHACCPNRLQVLQGHDIKAAYQLWAVKIVTQVQFYLIAIIETLKSRFAHLTANGKPRFSVSGFMLPACLYLRLELREWNFRLSRLFSFIRSLLLRIRQLLREKDSLSNVGL